MRRISLIGLALALSLALALPAIALQEPAAPQPQAKTRPEYDAYIAFFNEKEPQKKASLGEAFLVEYKESDFVMGTYQGLVQAYEQAMDWPKVMEAADRFAALPDTPFKTDNAKAFILQTALTAAQQANNPAKITEYGDKVLAVDANNLNAQLVLSAMIPQRLPEDAAAKTAALNKAMDLGTKAHDQVEAIFKGAKPDNIPQAQWDEQKKVLEGQVHGTLGLIHYHKGEYADTISMYEYVLQLDPKDQGAYFYLGVSYGVQATDAQKLVIDAYTAENEAKAARADQVRLDELVFARQALEADFTTKRDMAIDTLAKAVALPDEGYSEAARQQLERIYKNKNNDSLDGLDQIIAEKKAQLG